MSQFTIELRPGEGGDDAYAFCLELKAAIVAYARRRGDAVELHEGAPRTRTLEVALQGSRRAYERLAGVHRVQRIPKNDRRGRRHTSTATVAVIEQQPQIVVKVADEDLDVFTYRGSGKGGQHRNKTDSAVRVVHRPTGVTVVVEHSRSQWQNLQQAKLVLEKRLQDMVRRAHLGEGAPQSQSPDRLRRTTGEAVHAQRTALGGRIAPDGGDGDDRTSTGVDSTARKPREGQG